MIKTEIKNNYILSGIIASIISESRKRGAAAGRSILTTMTMGIGLGYKNKMVWL
jgi:hypothetical protein